MPVVRPRPPRVRIPPELRKRQIGLRMRPELLAALRKYAAARDEPVAEIIDDACVAFLNSTSTGPREKRR